MFICHRNRRLIFRLSNHYILVISLLFDKKHILEQLIGINFKKDAIEKSKKTSKNELVMNEFKSNRKPFEGAH